MTATRRNVILMIEGLLLAGVVGASLVVAAGASAAEPQEADIRVRVIHAKNGEEKFDPQLQDLRKLLVNQDGFKFSSYKQVIDEKVHLGVSDQRALGLLKGKNLNVTLTALTREKATIQLKLLGQTGLMLDTTVSAGPHKLFFLAGPRYDGGILFIAIEPHYDPDAGATVPDVGAVRHAEDGKQPKRR